MPATATSKTDPTAPPPEEALALARELVKRFYASCFWFWRPDAEINTRAEIRLVVEHLRELGGHEAWAEAQRLWKCL